MDAMLHEILKASATLDVDDGEWAKWRRQGEIWNAWYKQACKSKGADVVGLKADELRALRKPSKCSLETTPGVNVPGLTLSRPAIFVRGSRPSHTRLESLKPVKLRELRFETQSGGSSLILRLISEPYKYTCGLVAAVKDVNGTIQRMFLLDYEPHFSIYEGLHEGVVVAIKEPTYGICADQQNGLRIDHPADIVVLSAANNLVPDIWRQQEPNASITVKEWEDKSLRARKQSRMEEAIKCTSRALTSSYPLDSATRKRLWTSRAMMFEMSGQYEQAWIDIQKILAEQPSHALALQIGARVLYKLGQWEECYEQLQVLFKNHPENSGGRVLLLQVEERLRESRTGQYDFNQMTINLDRSLPKRNLDHASFTKRVRIGSSSLHGRGLFATEAINAGDVVLCEKAFVVANSADYPGADPVFATAKGKHQPIVSTSQYWYNIETRQAIVHVQSMLLPQVMKKLLMDPCHARQFYDLSGDPVKCTGNEGMSVDGQTVIDSHLAEAIIESNGFKCGTRTSDQFQSVLAGHAQNSDNPRPVEASPNDDSYGLWLLSSYINHSCVANSVRSFIGDMLIIRAGRHIAAGEEITHRYCAVKDSVKHRHQELGNNWGFNCRCSLCLADLALSAEVRESRRIILSNIASFLVTCALGNTVLDNSTQSKFEVYIAGVAATFPSNLYKGLPKIGFAQSCFEMGMVGIVQNDQATAVVFLKRALQALCMGLCLDSEGLWAEVIFLPGSLHGSAIAVDVIMYLADTFLLCQPPLPTIQIAQLLKAQARLLYRILVGEDSTFNKKYQHLRCADVPSTMDGFVKPKNWETGKQQCRIA